MQTQVDSHFVPFLKNLSIEVLNEMQLSVIQKATTSSDDLMVLAPTGSGKTLAFLLPLVAALDSNVTGVQALIVAPSRELSIQIEQVFRTMKTGFKVVCCYGGHAAKVEEKSLSEAPAVIIGTPGRLADHVLRGSFQAETIKFIVLDEFDKSLQMGFSEQLEIIFKSLSRTQRHILTSATRLQVWPTFLPFSRPETLSYLDDQLKKALSLKLARTTSFEKVDFLMRLVASFNQEATLVFCNHREAVERISELFSNHNFDHGILHGAMDQIDREKNIIEFRGGAHNVLIATDLASRGLDIPEIKHVVHYQLPPQEEAFIHRNGRTARMNKEGQAYLIVADDESLPPYIDSNIEEVTVSNKLVLPPPPIYSCLYISAGKKDKISKGDVVGLLIKKGNLQQDDIGIVTLLDFSSYVTVKRSHVDKLLKVLKNERLKKIKVKIEVAS